MDRKCRGANGEADRFAAGPAVDMTESISMAEQLPTSRPHGELPCRTTFLVDRVRVVVVLVMDGWAVRFVGQMVSRTSASLE